MEGHATRSSDAATKPQGTTAGVSTRDQPRDEAPETEDDILERMIILSTPADAKKAALQVIEAKK
jgi:hypothetical protein